MSALPPAPVRFVNSDKVFVPFLPYSTSWPIPTSPPITLFATAETVLNRPPEINNHIMAIPPNSLDISIHHIIKRIMRSP